MAASLRVGPVQRAAALACLAAVALCISGCGPEPAPDQEPPPAPSRQFLVPSSTTIPGEAKAGVVANVLSNTTMATATATATTTTPTTTTTTTVERSLTCSLSPAQATWCVASANASASALDAALSYVCGNGGVDCSACLSNDTRAKASWSLNAYFQAHSGTGVSSCNFSGAGELVQPPYSMCRPSAAHSIRCRPDPSASRERLVHALEWLCGEGGLDCSPIAPGGPCVFAPEVDLQSKCEWAFDAYYEAHRARQSAAACDFEGAGALATAACGAYNNGNARTGRGFAFTDPSCLEPTARRCGCITEPLSANESISTGCRTCVTHSPDPSVCETLCPWSEVP